MADDDVNLDAPAGTPPDEGAPDELSGTPPDETELGDEPSDDDAPSDEPADEDASSEGEDDPADGPPTDPAERKAWENLSKKYAYIKDPEDRQEAVARAYWDKARYAKEQRIRADTAEAELVKLRSEREQSKPKEEPKEEPPHPDVAKIEGRIQALYAKNTKIQEEQQSRLAELTKFDREVAIATDRLKDAYDENKPALEDRLRLAQRDYEYVRRQYLDANDKIEDLRERMEQELANRDWVVKFNRDQANRTQQEQHNLEIFQKEFPREVDELIEAKADELTLPKDPRIRQAIWKHVNRALMVDLRQANVPDVGQVDLPGMIERFVKEYAEDRDFAGRSNFKARSDAKLAVAARSGTGVRKAPAIPAKAAPASSRPPVPAALLSGDTSPAMARARRLLVSKFGG